MWTSTMVLSKPRATMVACPSLPAYFSAAADPSSLRTTRTQSPVLIVLPLISNLLVARSLKYSYLIAAARSPLYAAGHIPGPSVRLRVGVFGFPLRVAFHRGCFGHQLELAQGTHEFSVRLFRGGAHSVDHGVIAVFGPRDGFGNIGICVELGPIVVDVHFHLPRRLFVSSAAIGIHRLLRSR